MREMRARKEVVYNEQELLKQSSQPELAELAEQAPAKRSRASADPAARARRQSGEPRGAVARRPRKPSEEDEAAEAEEMAVDGGEQDQLDASELPPGTDNAIYRACAGPRARAHSRRLPHAACGRARARGCRWRGGTAPPGAQPRVTCLLPASRATAGALRSGRCRLLRARRAPRA